MARMHDNHGPPVTPYTPSVAAPFPIIKAPMAATEVPRRPFHHPGWVYEEKADGWRALVYKDAAGGRLVSRNGEGPHRATRWRMLKTEPSAGLLEGWARDHAARSYDVAARTSRTVLAKSRGENGFGRKARPESELAAI